MKLPHLESSFNFGSEKQLYRDIVKPMASRASVFCMRVENPIHRGTPDCWCCKSGQTMWLELKFGNGLLSPVQVSFMEAVCSHGVSVFTLQGAKNEGGQYKIILSMFEDFKIEKKLETLVYGDENFFDYLL